MKKFNFKKIITIFTTSVLCLGLFGIVGCNKLGDSALNKDSFGIAGNGNNKIFLTSSEVKVVESEAGSYLERTIVATVNGDESLDKYLYWNVAWERAGNTEDVTEYVNIFPVEEGGHTASVYCYKNFEELGNVVITATARLNGVSGSCIAYYLGKPTSLLLNGQGSGTLYVQTGTTTTYDIQLTNALGVGSLYGKNYEVTPFVFGTLNGTLNLKVNGPIVDSIEATISNNGVNNTSIDYNFKNDTFVGTLDCSYFFDASNYFDVVVEDGKVKVTPYTNWLSQFPLQDPRTGVVFVPTGNAESNVTIGFTIEDLASGVKSTYYVAISESINSVQLSDIYF